MVDLPEGKNWSGLRVMVGGFAGIGLPDGLVAGLLKNRTAVDLTLIANDAGPPGSALSRLVRSGRVRRLIGSHVGIDRRVREFVAAGGVDFEAVPQGGVVERIRAAAVGLDGVVFPGGHIGRAISADAALVSAAVMDRYGNLAFSGMADNFNRYLAMAAVDTFVQADCRVHHLDPSAVDVPWVFVNASKR